MEIKGIIRNGDEITLTGNGLKIAITADNAKQVLLMLGDVLSNKAKADNGTGQCPKCGSIVKYGTITGVNPNRDPYDGVYCTKCGYISKPL